MASNWLTRIGGAASNARALSGGAASIARALLGGPSIASFGWGAGKARCVGLLGDLGAKE